MMKRTILLGLSVAMLGACGTQQPAVYDYYGVQKGAGSAGIHTVLPGDTLYSISKNYQIPMREIILLNKLKPPYILNAGYRMKLPPPNEYRIRVGDTIQSVAQLYEVSPNRLASLNGLRPPYYLPPGQVLRLPTSSNVNANLNANASRYRATNRQAYPSSSSSSFPSSRESQTASLTPSPVTREVLGVPAGLPPAKAIVVPATKPAFSKVSATQSPVTRAQTSSAQTSEPQVKTAAVTRAKTPQVPKLASGKFMRPVDGRVISRYGAKKDGLHNDGINIKAVQGTPVRAAQNGVVVYNGDDLDGYGNLVLIRHENKMMTAYAHLDKTLVKRGARVARGQSIGTVGKTGQVDTPQLHFEVRKGSTPLNPDKFL